MTKINKVESFTRGKSSPAKTNRESGNYDPYEALAAAIVEQAVKDLRKVLKRKRSAEAKLAMYEALLGEGHEVELGGKTLTLQTLRREVTKAKEHNERVSKDLREIEQFFWSDWFIALSDLDGLALLEAVTAEYDVPGASDE